MIRSCFYILLLISTHIAAQHPDSAKIDSLERVLANASSEKTKVDILNEMAYVYYNSDLKKCLSHAHNALELANESGYDIGEEKALSLLTRTHRRIGNFSVALEFNLRQITLCEKLQDTLRIIDGYTSLGNIHIVLQNYAEAKSYLRKALMLGILKDAENVSAIINYYGRIYTLTGNYDSALYWIKRAYDRATQQSKDSHVLSYIYTNLGEVYHHLKNYKQSIYYYKTALNLPEENTTLFGKAATLNGLALTYLDLKQYQLAKEIAHQSLEISKENSYREKTAEAYGILYKIYESTGDYRNALSYYKLFNLTMDSIFSEDKLQYIENLKVYFETEKMAQENELLRKDAELKDIKIKQAGYFTIIGLISSLSLAAILLVLYMNYRQKKKTNKILSDYSRNLEEQVELRTKELVKTNMELIKQNSQLEQFGYITAHNLRAPVARILGLANIINNKYFSMPADKEVLDKLHLAAKEMDTIIYDLNTILDIKKGIQYSYEEIDLHDRLEKVKSILMDKIRDSNLTIVENFSTAKTCYAIPAYIESIFYNLISNSIKYRAADRDPVISISSEVENEKLKIVFKDNGIGIDLSKTKEKVFTLYQRFHDHVEGKGIGLFLVKTQLEAMNGSIDLDSKVNKGTVFYIKIPLKTVSVS